MTEPPTGPLAVLLREEADRVGVPAAPTREVLARGHRARRRRTRTRTGLAAGLVVACVAGFLALDRAGDERLDGDLRIADAERAMTAYVTEGAYAVGDELVVGANRFEWHEPIKALHYTSAGVVIQSGENPDRDEGGSRYTLITPTGEWSGIDVALDDQVVGFETASTHLAYAVPVGGGRYDVVVHDVADDQELARVRIEVADGYGGWRAPPVAIHGDLVWVRGPAGATEWDWRTGVVRPAPGTGSTYEIAGGRYADWQDRSRWIIRSMADRAEVRELDLRDGWYGFFSPDGSHLRAFPNELGYEASVDYEFFSVETGGSWQLRDVTDSYDRVELGWTPSGDVLELLDDVLSLCDGDTGACEEVTSDLGDGTVRLGGEPYGS